MKIMQIIPNFAFGGAETMCQNLSIELVKMGHDVVVISLYNFHNSITENLEKNGIKLIYLNKHSGLDFKAIRRLRRIIKEEKPDVIHSHIYSIKYAVFSDLFLKHKKVHTVHSIAEKESNTIGRILNYFFFKFHRVIPVALSSNVQQTIKKVYHISFKKIPIITNGVPLDRCYKKIDYDFKDQILVMHTGSLIPLKNHNEMINAAIDLHKYDSRVKFLFVGDGILKQELQELINKSNAEEYIELYGTSTNVYELLHKADIFILPSIYEGIPMSIIEAMGSGLPIVASNVGGIPDMITDNIDGLLCEPNSNDIYLKIAKFIDDIELRKKCGANALFRSKDFSSSKMAENYYFLYKGGDLK